MTESIAAIVEFIQSRFRGPLAGRAIGHDEPLFTSGVIDSFGVLELIAFLEDTFRISIDTTRHELREFDTVNKIDRLIAALREGA
jgi:acyl carrier protein/D-alanine--poly(phosphoribitol) ligase subunit 2